MNDESASDTKTYRAFCPLGFCGWYFVSEDRNLAVHKEREHWEDYHQADAGPLEEDA